MGGKSGNTQARWSVERRIGVEVNSSLVGYTFLYMSAYQLFSGYFI